MIFNRIIILSFLSLFLAFSQSERLIEVDSTSPRSTGEINITAIYSENCTEPTANNFIADWKFGISVTNAPNNAISYQRNSEMVLSHTLTGTTDTLTISGVPADGGASDTIKVWFTSEPTCGDTIILKRPLHCPTPIVLMGFCSENAALSQTTSASSEAFGGLAANAVNGNTSGNMHHSAIETNPWWQVDLAANETIDSIIFWNRVDFASRFNGGIIEVLDASANVVFTHTVVTAGAVENINVGGIIGKSVRVRLAGTNKILNFHEVQVFVRRNCTNEIGAICSAVTPSSIVGSVWEDFNFDGIINENATVGVHGTQVLAYDCDNNLVTTTYTDANGNYQFTGLTPGTTYRVEFILPESVSCWANTTQKGADNGTTVQFVQPGNCANLGVANPTDYCEDNPQVIVSCFVNGDPLGGGSSGTFDALVGFNYFDSGTASPDHLAVANQVGAVWGVAYQKSTQTLFTSAFQKRHAGYGPLPSGSTGERTGTIYKMDVTTNTVTPFFNIDDFAGISTGTDIHSGLPADNNQRSVDSLSFDAVGKISLGDLDISEDGQTLWVTNLNENSLLEIQIGDSTTPPTAADVTVHDLDLAGITCSNGEFRAWGLKVYRGKIYIGGVCTAENGGSAADLHAYVLEYEPNSGLNDYRVVIDFPLDYQKGCSGGEPGLENCEWYPWINEYPASRVGLCCPGYGQPILSDIEFDIDGSMIITFSDRFGHQAGPGQFLPDGTVGGDADEYYSPRIGGELIRACYNNGGFVLEDNGSCGGITTAGAGNAQGLGGGEFYFGENYFGHDETAQGAVTFLPGSNSILATVMDPLAFNSFGVSRFNNTTGNSTSSDRYQVFLSSGGTTQATFEKGGSLGGIAILCASAPIEIGNYVWEDTNGDGIQGACEPGIAGVNVTLYTATGDSLTTVQTDANGQYYFNSATAGLDTILPNTMYSIVVGESGQFDTGTSALNIGEISYIITVDSIGQGTLPRQNDSDGTLASSVDADFDGQPYLTITTGNSGSVDHTFDFGFIPRYDYGDLPDIANGTTGINDYETYDSTGGPSHLIIPGLFLGDTVDVDTDGFPNAQALGDDNDGVDDEDGVIIFPNLNARPGGTIRLPLSITNTTGNLAYLEAWIDWNGDGDFLDANEMVVNVDDIGNGSFNTHVEIMIPNNALTESSLGFRVRYSNTNNMTPYGRINSGEVEDYLLRIDCSDNVCLPVQGEIKKE